jgi:hypothetical protein
MYGSVSLWTIEDDLFFPLVSPCCCSHQQLFLSHTLRFFFLSCSQKIVFSNPGKDPWQKPEKKLTLEKQTPKRRKAKQADEFQNLEKVKNSRHKWKVSLSSRERKTQTLPPSV